MESTSTINGTSLMVGTTVGCNRDPSITSESEAITEKNAQTSVPLSTTSTTPTPPHLPRFFPKHCDGRPIYHGNKEALGWALDSVGRSVPSIGAGAFLGTALIRLAKEAAGCATEADENGFIPECNERIYFIRPSSLLTTYTLVVGLISAALLPFFGAMVDYTSHRRLMGRWMSLSFSALLFPQIFLSKNTWFAVAVLQIGVAFTGWAQTMVTYAYLPELTTSEQQLNQYTQSFTIISFSSMICFLVVTAGIATFLGFADDDVAVARLGAGISFCTSCTFLYLAWGPLLQKRPPSRILPEGQNLWTAGFIQVYHTILHIAKHLPALKWFYLANTVIDAALNSLATIMITYFADTLGFSSIENGTAILLMLIGSIPGALIAGRTVTLFNPVRSEMMATAILAITTVFAAIVLTGPGQQIETYIITAFWGLGIGWKWTTDRLLASTLIPPGQDAELMGVYLFAGQVLTWLPPLVFTALNEAGVSQSIGIGSLSIYLFLGLVALCMIGDYSKAIAQTGREHAEITNHFSLDVPNSLSEVVQAPEV